MDSKQHQNISTFIHLGVFSKFFIPFGNYAVPLIIWLSNKDKSEFIDDHGKEAINFQLSTLLYTLVFLSIVIAFLFFGVLDGVSISELINDDHDTLTIPEAVKYKAIVVALGFGFISIVGYCIEIYYVIKASIKAKKGELYSYPLNIPFIK